MISEKYHNIYSSIYILGMRILLLVMLIVSSVKSDAQVSEMYLLSADSSYKRGDGLFQISADGMIGSNVLDNMFMKKSILGGNLENQHLNQLSDEMKDQNRAGFIVTAGLEFLNFRDTLFKHPQWGLRVGINSNYHGAVSFSRDLFKTIYRGNTQFANDSAVLGPLNFQYQAWQKFGVGIFNKHNLSSVTLSLVEGQSYQSLILTEAGLYTSPNGDSLAVNYSGDYLRSDTTKSGWANGSGLGAAIDLEYNLPLADQNGFISISLHDFGFVAWNNLSEKFTFDSLSTWTGAQVKDVFKLSTDTLDLPSFRDSMHYSVQQKRIVSPLPASVHLRYCRVFNKQDYYEAGMSMWPNRAAVPLVYAGLGHFIGQHFLFSERVSFGGYGRFGIGAEVQWMPRGAWLLRLGTRHLEGFTMGSAHSRDLYFTAAKTF